MSEETISVPREKLERIIKVLRYAAHPQRSPHADDLEQFINDAQPKKKDSEQ